MARACLCGRPICRQNRSGRCASCAQIARNTPELIARRRATLVHRLATEPGMRARYVAQLEKTRAGTANDYRLRRLRMAKLPAWVPVEYRELYRELRHQIRLSEAEARAAIDTQISVSARAFAATGQLQQHKGDAR